MRGGARRPPARRTLCTLSVRPRAPTKQMGLFQQPASGRSERTLRRAPRSAQSVSAAPAPDPPLVSVVLPTYNRACLIGRSLRSALAQTLTDLELIVVDDGSTDDTPALLGEVSDARVRVFRLDENRGASRARNAGIERSRGDWVAFLDSDDEWEPAKLDRQLGRARADPSAGLVYCGYERRDQVTEHRATPRWPLHEGDVLDHLLAGWRFPTALAMVRRAALLEVGGFSADLDCYEDYDLWLRLAAARHRFAVVDEPLVIKHHHAGDHASGDPAVRQRCLAVLDARWGSLVRERLGPAAHRHWKRSLEAGIHLARFMQVRQALARGDRRSAWRGCLALGRRPWRSRRFLAQALVLTLLGRAPYRLLARAWTAAIGGGTP